MVALVPKDKTDGEMKTMGEGARARVTLCSLLLYTKPTVGFTRASAAKARTCPEG